MQILYQFPSVCVYSFTALRKLSFGNMLNSSVPFYCVLLDNAGRSKSKSKAGKGKSDSKIKSEAAQKPFAIELSPEGGASIDTLDKDSPVSTKPGPSLELEKMDAPPQLSKYGKASSNTSIKLLNGSDDPPFQVRKKINIKVNVRYCVHTHYVLGVRIIIIAYYCWLQLIHVQPVLVMLGLLVHHGDTFQ